MASEEPPSKAYGWQVEMGQWGLRGIIASPELTMSGNLVLRVGHEGRTENKWVDTDGSEVILGWAQTEHVVLTPEEAIEFMAELLEHAGPLLRKAYEREVI